MTQPERPAHDLAGTVLEGAYRLVRLVGEGGMGAVYEAVQLRLNKRVAVKLMARELAANTESLARFHREAEITSLLGHPHLVSVIDFGTAESGEPYLVMEYLEGEDLEHRLERVGVLPLGTAVATVGQVAAALAAAHAHDIVHRDLKPANIFLLPVAGEPDFVKVLDFGISKVKAARARLTGASMVVGTPNYMSPEQASGRVDETDHHADQWALACIAWEMLSGRTPFVADQVAPLFYQIAHLEPPPLSLRVPNLPPGVEPVLRRALSKRPVDRFPSIRAFSRALEAAVSGRLAEPTPLPGVVPRLSGAPPGPSRPSKQVTTFSQSTGEVAGDGPVRRFKPRHGVAFAAVLVLVAGAVLWSVAGRPSTRPIASQPQPIPNVPIVTPLDVSGPTTAVNRTPTFPAKDPAAKSASRGTRAFSAGHTPKHRAIQSLRKRRLFQKL